jgi:hypothetical protein
MGAPGLSTCKIFVSGNHRWLDLKQAQGWPSERYADRNGGYTRVLRTGFRRGDNTEMAILELV